MRPIFNRLAVAFRSLYSFDRPGCQVRLSIRQRLPVIAFPILLLWYLVRPSPVDATGTAALGGLLLLSYLWASSMAKSVSGERRLHYAALQVGDELEEQVILRNNSAMPALWVEFIDHSNLPGYTFSSVRSTGGNSTTEWHTNTTCTRRGVFTLGPWEMRCGDPFGLFLVRQTWLQKNEILVYPPLAPLPARLLPHGQVQGEERPLHQPLRAETQDAFTARPYQPGDPLRHIHWPITARHDVPYVKVFEPEDSSTVWLLADLDAAAHTGQGPDSSLETMILLLASLASELLRQRVAVGLLAYTGSSGTPDEDLPLVVLPQRSSLHLWDILRTLAVLTPAPGRPFQKTLEKARMLVGGRDQVLAVTPSLRPEWLAGLHQLNRGRRGQGASVILLDPVSFSQAQPAEGPAQYRGTYPANTAGRPSSGAYGGGGDLGQEAPPKVPLHSSGAELFTSLLARQGIRCSVVQRGELRPIAGAYGELSRWEFKTLGTGRVFVRHAPRQSKGEAK